jgi:hypothetical protein
VARSTPKQKSTRPVQPASGSPGSMGKGVG